MQQGYPKRTWTEQATVDYRTISYESIIKSLHKLFYGTEMPEDEVQEMVKKYQDQETKLTDSSQLKG